MPLPAYVYLKRRYHAPIPSKYSPGEDKGAIISNLRLNAALRSLEPVSAKVSSIMHSSFIDEYSKIASATGYPVENAQVLRSLLRAMLGRDASMAAADSAHLSMENQLMFGTQAPSMNYAQQAQEQISNQLLRDTRLQAVIEAQHSAATRTI